LEKTVSDRALIIPDAAEASRAHLGTSPQFSQRGSTIPMAKASTGWVGEML